MSPQKLPSSAEHENARPLLRRCDIFVFAAVLLTAFLFSLGPRLWAGRSGKVLARITFDNLLLCEFDPAQLAPRTYSLKELLEVSSTGLSGAENRPEDSPKERPEDSPKDRPENLPENRPEDSPGNLSENRPEDSPGLWPELPPMFIAIEADGGVRVAASDCPDQYCVRRGVCRKAGDFAACVPNKVILTLLPAGDHEADNADSGIDMVVGDPAPPEEP